MVKITQQFHTYMILNKSFKPISITCQFKIKVAMLLGVLVKLFIKYIKLAFFKNSAIINGNLGG